MIQGNYDKIIEKISKVSGVGKEELERRVEAKRAKLAGLISKEGAAQVIAAELGISFDKEKLKINELLPGMKKINTIGKVLNVSPVRNFTTKSGVESKVTNLVIADETSNVKVVLWDTNHVELVESGKIREGVVVEIVNGGIRDNEIHLGSFSELKISNELIEGAITEKVVREKNIVHLRVGDSAKLRAFIVQSFEPKFFHVCNECGKKATQEGDAFTCVEHGKCVPEKRALINIVLDDGTETIRSVVFHEGLKHLGITELDNTEALITQKQNLLGKEMMFSGNVRMNKFFNNPEFIIDIAKEVDLDELIGSLGNKE